MQSSKINQLRESSFREKRNKDRKQLNEPRTVSSRGQPVSEEVIDPKQILQYELKLPLCPFHHQPIRFVCLRQDCRSSTFGVCSNEECRQMHADPDADLIEISVFNEVIRDSCSSLQLLKGKLKKYFKEFREKLIHRLDMSIEKAIYLVDNVHTQEVPRLIRQKRHAELDSYKLGSFIRKELSEGASMRNRMQALRNRVSQRITDRQAALERLLQSKEYEYLLLGDFIRFQEEVSSEVVGKVQIRNIQSSIIIQTEETEILLKFLRENRTPAFNKITPLFKASDHQFSSKTFHQAVDGVAPILFLVKTTMGKKFGAYLNCKLNDREEWIADVSGLSFIFSLDRQESYRLKSQAQSRLKAAFGGVEGIQMGSGCDLYLCEDCNSVRRSGSNLGGSFRLPGHLQFNSAKSRAYLAGEQTFLVQQFEVFFFQ